VLIALRTQQIIAHESGVTNTVDPLGGSYFVEALTEQTEQAAMEYLTRIEEFGGVLACIKNGFFQRESAGGSGHLRQERQPATHLRFRELAKQEAQVLGEQIVLEQPQGLLMPLQGFWTAVVVALILQIVLDSLLNGHGRGFLARSFATRRSVRRLRLPTTGHGGALGGDIARRCW